MVIRRNPEPGHQAVLWLATAFVVLIGAGACAFIIVSTVEQPSQHLLIAGGLFGGVVLLLTRLAIPRDSQAGGSWMRLWLAMTERSHPKTVLRIGRKKPASAAPLGTNAPPTVESVREAAEQNVSWVPHGPAPDRANRSR